MKNSRVKSKAAISTAAPTMQQQSQPPSEGISEQIAIAAYFKAEARGFEPGHKLEDWLAAESEVH